MTDGTQFDCSDPTSGHGVFDVRDGSATPIVVGNLAMEIASDVGNAREFAFFQGIIKTMMPALQQHTFWKCPVCEKRPGVEYLRLHGFIDSGGNVVTEVEQRPSLNLLGVALLLVLTHGRVPAEYILGLEDDAMREEFARLPGDNVDEFLRGLLEDEEE